MSSVLVGHGKCPMGGDTRIYAGNRKGGYLMTRCDCCGFQQGTGKKLQQQIWDNAVWLDGKQPPLPSKVNPNNRPETDNQTESPVNNQAESDLEELTDFDPMTDMPETEEPVKKGGRLKAFAIGTATVVGLGGFLMALARA